VRVNSAQAVAALDWYVHMLRKYAPPQVRDWNWPEIAGAFARGRSAAIFITHSSAALLNDPSQSAVIGRSAMRAGRRGRPDGARVDLELELSRRLGAPAPRAAGYMALHQWATCEENQARTSFRFPDHEAAA